MTTSKQKSTIEIAIARGDGIGPEIMDATLKILESAGADLMFHEVEVGEKVYLKGFPAGIEPKTWEILRSSDAFLKAPVTTPQGGGFRSLNVTIRTALGLYANVRPCVSYYPFVDTKYPGMNLVIVRENEEDLYTGIEYRQTEDSYHALKIITKRACEKIIRYAFEYAKDNGRKKVTCFTKDNILKMSDGLFHKIFEEIAKDYPSIMNEHWIVDIGAAKMADTPESFDVIVMPNLYGDILSDIAAQIAGSVGIAGSANIGDKVAMFEAIHGSAPRRAGQNLANPSGLLLAAVMMLVHVGRLNAAETIHNAWLRTLEEGIHTYDIFDEKKSRLKVGTKEFGKAIVERLGKLPEVLPPVHYGSTKSGLPSGSTKSKKPSPDTHSKRLYGSDLFIDSNYNLQDLHKALTGATKDHPILELSQISNRGATMWPSDFPPPSSSNHWRCRFTAKIKGTKIDPEALIDLQRRLAAHKLDVTGLENLYFFDDIPGFSLSQHEQ